MRRNGGRRHEWIKYAALFVLAVAAFGVAAIAPMGPRGVDEGVPVTASASAAVPTAKASSAPTSPAPAPTATATAPQPGIELPGEPVLLVMGDSYTAGVGADQPDQGGRTWLPGSSDTRPI